MWEHLLVERSGEVAALMLKLVLYRRECSFELCYNYGLEVLRVNLKVVYVVEAMAFKV